MFLATIKTKTLIASLSILLTLCPIIDCKAADLPPPNPIATPEPLDVVALNGLGTTTATPTTTVTPELSNAPQHMALLLPLSGTLAGPGNAIKEGFMAAYNAKVVDQNMDVHFYDTSAKDAAMLYQQALADGADYIVGPLTKNEVTKIAALDHPVPTILLNDVTMENSHNVYRFGLSPTYEAGLIAKKAAKDGWGKCLVIAPSGSWADDVVHSFAIELQNAGGQVIDRLGYDNTSNLDPLLKNFLQFVEPSAPKLSKLLLAKKDGIEPSRRKDFDMIFLLAYPSKARQIMPLLKYYFAGNVPVYATSAVYAGSPNKMRDKDLDGIVFCDNPRIFKQTLENKNWPETWNSYSRLYTLGMDSFTLAFHLKELLLHPNTGVHAESGVFYATPEKKLSRKLVFRQFSKGVAEKICRNKLA